MKNQREYHLPSEQKHFSIIFDCFLAAKNILQSNFLSMANETFGRLRKNETGPLGLKVTNIRAPKTINDVVE